MREGSCRGCCPRCEVLLIEGLCPSCPLPSPAFTPASLLHDVGEVLDLRQWNSALNVNSFLALGWILLRVADVHDSFLMGWPRTRGTPSYPSWYEEEQRKREELIEAFSTEALELE